ncbi:MAG TPA: sulfite exporter TauE/SafE family protein [Pirellulales bacterium]|nr:sulfite exporter TauE/SafE family protein [Pirellulales bacterium]
MNWEIILVCCAAMAAGAVNSVAGGGTLLTFPVLTAVLMRKFGDHKHADVVANQTSTMALIPGIFAAAWGYRSQLKHSRHWLKWLLPPSLLGGLLGGWLVVGFPDQFSALVPWLILTAAVLFVLQPQIARWTGIGAPHAEPHGGTLIAIIVFQFFVAIYGGYFGAGIGILMLSALGLMGLADIHVMNGLKNCLAFAINIMALTVFLTRGEIDWSLAGPMIACSMLGGFVGATLAQKIDKVVVRRIIVVIGFSLATYYFWRQFSGK